ncbi:MAG: hypothetical protein H6838_11635 [Planctomycetes bacterium]|nr:hypothetical protein [Planctomycetota bacterium]
MGPEVPHHVLRSLPLLACALLGSGACTFTPAPSRPCPPLPPPPALLRTAPPAPRLLALNDDGTGRLTGTLAAGDERIEFTWLRHRDGLPTRPCVLLVPILAGGAELMTSVANRMFARDFDVAWCERAGSALVAPQRGRDLDELLRRTVLHQRALLHWLRRAEAPPPQQFVLGISMGGMVGAILGAAEPDLDGLAICLAGGDFPSLVLASGERRVQRWVDWRRRTDGVGDDHLGWELRQQLRLEPLRVAPSIDTRKVLFVSAQFDDVVPRRNQDLLWEALGRPARLRVPFGHYTAALAIDEILGAAAAHFRARCRSTES